MTHRKNRIRTILAVACLALLTAAALPAQQDPMPNDEEITLTGQLSYVEDGDAYVLVEQDSGDSIILEGTVDFASHVDTTVDVTGKWAEDSEGNRYFKVSRIEAAP